MINKIKNKSWQLGFDLFAVTKPSRVKNFSKYQEWLENGYQADMRWMEKNLEKKADTGRILPNCQSIVVLGVSYFNRNFTAEHKDDLKNALIARYAWGDDYHIVLKKKLIELGNYINNLSNHDYVFCGFTDTGPVLERELASQAGLGWIGKNGNLINYQIGSYFLIASLFTEARIENYRPKNIGGCGSCQKCLLACPTKALVKEKTVDARKCIAYHTIENRGDIPATIKEKMGNRIFGCYICQEVCPWNRFAKKTRMPELEIMNNRDCLTKSDILKMTQEEYQQCFRNSAVKRAKWEGMQRNTK